MEGCNVLSNVPDYGGLFTSLVNIGPRGIVINPASDLGLVFSCISRYCARNTNDAP